MSLTMMRKLFVLLVLLSVACPAGAAEKNFPAGSWIIPMDSLYQPEADQGIFEAYGMVWELLSNGVTIHWIVDPNKQTPAAVDFSVFDASISPVVVEVNHAGGTMALGGVGAIINYSGGPWVIHADDVPTVRKVLGNDAWDQVNIHESRVAFSANVQRELFGTPPKIALMNDTEDPNSGNAIKILASYLVLANICGEAYELVTPNQIRDGILQRALDPFTLLWAPHWAGYEKAPYDVDSDGDGVVDADQITGKIREFLEDGHSIFAECASIEVFEHSANGHFLTDYGIGHDGGTMDPAKMVYNDPASIFAQVGDLVYAPEGGHIHNWRPFVDPNDATGPPSEPYDLTGMVPIPNRDATYNSTVTRFVHDDANGLNIKTNADLDQWDYYVGGHLDGDPSKGYVVYLGGHSYGDSRCASNVIGGGGGAAVIPGPPGTHLFSIQFDAPPLPGVGFDITVSGYDDAGLAFSSSASDVKVDGTDVIAGADLELDFSNAILAGSTISNIGFTNTTAGVLTITEVRIARTDGLNTPEVVRVTDDDLNVDLYNGPGLPLEAVVPGVPIPASNYQIAAGAADLVRLVWRRDVTNNQKTTFTVTYQGGKKVSLVFDENANGLPADTVTSADGSLQIDFSAAWVNGREVRDIFLRNLTGAVLNIEAVRFRWENGRDGQKFRIFRYQNELDSLAIDSDSPAYGTFGVKAGASPIEIQIAPAGGIVQTVETSCGDNSACGWKNAAAVRYILNTLFNLQFTVNDKEFSRSAPIVDKDNLLFVGTFKHPSWRGHLYAFDATRVGSAPLWDAANVMPAADARLLYANAGGVISDGLGLDGAGDYPTKTSFTFANVGLFAPFLAMTDPVDADHNPERQVINRVRGKKYAGTDPANPAHYIDIPNRLGAIEHSATAVVGPTHAVPGADVRPRVTYVGSLDGILHAVEAGHQNIGVLDAGTGVEKWGFIPGELLPRLQNDRTDPLAPRDFAAVDASPTVADVKIDYDGDGTLEARTVLVGAEGYGGKSIFVLDISDPDNPTPLWEATDIRQANAGGWAGITFFETPEVDANGDGVEESVQMGHGYKTAISRVLLEGTREATYVTYVATGYAVPGNWLGGVRIYCFRLDNGKKLWEFHANYLRSVNDIPGALTVVDNNNDGFADWVFVGDNNGRLWQLEAGTGVNPFGGATPLYNAGNDYPIATSPAIAVAGGQIVLFFGTGGTDWAPADANHIHKLLAVKAGPPAHHADVGQGVGEVLFGYDLGVGEKVFAAPVLTGNVLFVGTVVGTIESADPNDDIPAAGDPVGSLRALDVSNAVGGGAGAPVLQMNMANAGNFRGSLHLQNDALYATGIDGGVTQVGNPSNGAALAVPPVQRFFWRPMGR